MAVRYLSSGTVTGPSGGGTTNFITKWNSASALADSSLFDNGTDVVLTAAANTFGWSDLLLVRNAAADLQLGADSATPTTQRIKSPDGSGTNIYGATMVIVAGAGTGNAAGGSLVFQVSPHGASTASTVRGYTTMLTIGASNVAIANGQLLLAAGTTAAPPLAFSAESGLGLFRSAADTLQIVGGASLETINGTTAQVFNAYKTSTDADNYERFAFRADGVNCSIQSEQAGTGSARAINIATTGSAALQFWTNNIQRWNISAASGHLVAQTDNANDIGASGATRPRDVFAGGEVRAAILRTEADRSGVASMITFTNGENASVARSSGVGTVLFKDATNRNNLGFIKIYAGSSSLYVPVFSAD